MIFVTCKTFYEYQYYPSTTYMKKQQKKLIKILNTLSVIFVLICTGVIYYLLTRENTQLTISEYTFGIDISHYQGTIDWASVKTTHHPIQFIFVRATMGEDGLDKTFATNYQEAKNYGYLRGAYHYYRPNEDATKQFENFSAAVQLDSGDLRPVLDIEELGDSSLEHLRTGLHTWLALAEEAFGAKPIIYTGRSFYIDYLKGHVDDYPLWIACYSEKHKVNDVEWTFHQFTDKVIVNGIPHKVDGNDFKGTVDSLKTLCLVKGSL